ncbi:DUF4445 domain-containing protein [Alkalibaculum sp. M08DMB]|uniref:DUF4445 domain-containing protein n=1 Tax=Alkalibaculum sporogenes TaxID=2655001 RepID=A0A6A7KBG5_9FIRM|nr:ASKHA domain-containing protein [Alkalibaculum sporogenes]MPW26611.1 DUF4445 domain-containing protein [Alkalibaculum sporogenes]
MSDYINVNFPLLGKSIHIDENRKISDACELAGHPLNLVCGGKGKCNKCAVDISVYGELSTVLACQTQVSEGIDIMITEESEEAQILTTNISKNIKPNPSLYLLHLNNNLLNTPLCENDWDRIIQLTGIDLNEPSLEVLQSLSNNYHNPKGITLVISHNNVLDILPKDIDMPLYGLAYDIGSTSIVGYLYDLTNYTQVGISSKLNKQTSIAGDVVSRIEYTITNPNGLVRLQKLVIDTINEIAENICKENNIDKNNIYQASFCGNSTMQHLFLGLNPAHLGLAPFTSTTHRGVNTIASKLGININPRACVNFLPLLGGFVGADTTSVLLSLQNDDKDRLIIDLGTNGEIAVGRNYSYKVSSTACGPALEGAGLEFGMRGTKGAIERVNIHSGDLVYKVIGDVKPLGICGSGIIDIVSELLHYDIINKRGAIADPSTVTELKLAERIIINGNIKSFIIAYGNETESGKPILITQKDIRQVQLAKAAIFTGCLMLIEESNLKGEDLHEILIAGAFGNYIDINKAQYIGMIPYFKNIPVSSIGNAAATGCQMFLLSKDEEEECNKLAKSAIHVEIASNPNFTTGFMKNTYLNKLY